MKGQYKKIYWTEHSKIKMRQYGLSVSKILSILSRPERIEKGIAPETTAVMKTNSKIKAKEPYHKPINRFSEKTSLIKPKWGSGHKSSGEIWLMYKDVGGLRKIISAWRYPGVSKPGEEIPIPESIRRELLGVGDL